LFLCNHPFAFIVQADKVNSKVAKVSKQALSKRVWL
jgi:hypothetical protein